MITLFRRIRQKLIASGSITRYLLYALGEIFLVVIGILIALQVNNWNEERKQIDAEKGLLTSVLRSLESDSIAFAREITSLEGITEVHQAIYKYKTGELARSELVNIELIRRSSPMTPITMPNYPDLAEKVRDQSLKNEVLAYYQIMELLAFTEDNYNAIIEDQMRVHLAENGLLDYGYFDSDREPIYRDKFIDHLGKEEFFQLLFNVRVKIILLNSSLQRSIAQNSVLKEEILKYL